MAGKQADGSVVVVISTTGKTMEKMFSRMRLSSAGASLAVRRAHAEMHSSGFRDLAGAVPGILGSAFFY